MPSLPVQKKQKREDRFSQHWIFRVNNEKSGLIVYRCRDALLKINRINAESEVVCIFMPLENNLKKHAHRDFKIII